MHAYVYKSLRKADTYAYLARHDDFDCLPERLKMAEADYRSKRMKGGEES